MTDSTTQHQEADRVKPRETRGQRSRLGEVMAVAPEGSSWAVRAMSKDLK